MHMHRYESTHIFVHTYEEHATTICSINAHTHTHTHTRWKLESARDVSARAHTHTYMQRNFGSARNMSTHACMHTQRERHTYRQSYGGNTEPLAPCTYTYTCMHVHTQEIRSCPQRFRGQGPRNIRKLSLSPTMRYLTTLAVVSNKS